MESEMLEKVAPPAELAPAEKWHVSAIDHVVTTHPQHRLLTIWRRNLECLALDFVSLESNVVYASVRQLASMYPVPEMLTTDRTILSGPLVVAACSFQHAVGVRWSAPTPEHKAAFQDLVHLGRRLSDGQLYSCATLQAVFDGWRKRFNAALAGEVNPDWSLELGAPRADWLELYLEEVHSRGAAMAVETLRRPVPRSCKEFRDRQTPAEQRVEAAHAVVVDVLGQRRSVRKPQTSPSRSRAAEAVASTIVSSNA
ncbi:hypothetical protein NOV72_05012 [Caballeronia novacaledonica]|uniref:Uncharacterized protein n=1 Tax=Caballeronia novacaledonica TaxID=1544861 RepID=A0A2U3IC77_9BURK|nr:hypothetical protein NOV72_05012 [Caballeronia novacaledonica]